MPNKTPLLLLTALALAAAITYLIQSRKRDDHEDDEHDLHLDDVSDDVTVQVKNGRRSDVSFIGDVYGEEERESIVAREVTVDRTEERAAEISEVAVIPSETDEAQDVKGGSTERLTKDIKSEQQNDESIREAAISKAATIIQSMPEVSLADECIREVAENEATNTTAPSDTGVSPTQQIMDSPSIPTIHEEEMVPIKSESKPPSQKYPKTPPTSLFSPDKPDTITSTDKQPQEQSVPIKSETKPTQKKYPKTPPISLFSPDKPEELEAPTDTNDYSLLKNYWKHQSDKNAFSPPVEGTKPISEESSGQERKSMPRTSSKEEDVATAAAAGLMVAGVVNVLDRVYSPKTSQSFNEYTNEDEGMPLMDISIDQGPTKNMSDEQLSKESDSQLILPSGSSRSPSSGSDKSSSEDYVKIVRTPSGDPISESALLSRPVEVVEGGAGGESGLKQSGVDASKNAEGAVAVEAEENLVIDTKGEDTKPASFESQEETASPSKTRAQQEFVSLGLSAAEESTVESGKKQEETQTTSASKSKKKKKKGKKK